jgi:predicted dehydrogenase
MGKTWLKGGLVGCGAVANLAHMPGWQSANDVRIVAACDVNEEAALKTAKSWGIPRTYREISDMLRHEQLDFIDICTSPQTHKELAIQAIQAGLHVLIEKPIALDIYEAEEINTLAKERNIKLCVVHNRLFSPVIQKAKKLVDNGSIGELLMMDVHILGKNVEFLKREDHWCHKLPPPGGIFNEIAPHPAYLALAFIGEIKSARAIARKTCSFPWVKADELDVILESEKGTCSFTISLNFATDLFTVDLYGTNGYIEVDHIKQTISLRRPYSNGFYGLISERWDIVRPVFTAALRSTMERFRGRQLNRLDHQILIRKFVESLRNDTPLPVTGDDSLNTLKVLDKIWRNLL